MALLDEAHETFHSGDQDTAARLGRAELARARSDGDHRRAARLVTVSETLTRESGKILDPCSPAG